MGLFVVLGLLFQTAAEWKQAGVEAVANHKLQAALPAFEKACALDPRDEDACYYLGRTLFLLDRWEQAVDPFEKALRAAGKTSLAKVHRAMALNFVGLNRAPEAEQHFRQAVSLNPGPERLPEDPRIDYGAFLFRQGRTEEALPLLRDAVKAVPGSARAWTELGRVLLHAGKAEDAVSSLRKAVELNPRAASVRLLLGRAYMQAERREEGERELERAGRDLAQGSSTVR